MFYHIFKTCRGFEQRTKNRFTNILWGVIFYEADAIRHHDVVRLA